ncbi:MAG: hypothetical protein AAFZ14_05250 [Pseudomonadota bacterium]
MARPVLSQRLPEPLVLHVMPDKMRSTARNSIGLGLFLTGLCAVVFVYGAYVPLFFNIFLVIGLLLLYFGALSIGMARARPVALRIDRHGVSGYYVPALDWTDILRFDRKEARSTSLGIELFNRADVRNRQRRLMWRFNLRLPLSGNWHIIVPGDVLDAELDDIVATAQAFHSAAIARDQMPVRR